MAFEKRLTDANELLQKFCAKCNAVYSEEPCEPDECIFYDLVKNAPVADAVEVVRCKDCSYHRDYEGNTTGKVICKRFSTFREPDFYCAYGERRIYGNSDTD